MASRLYGKDKHRLANFSSDQFIVVSALMVGLMVVYCALLYIPHGL